MRSKSKSNRRKSFIRYQRHWQRNKHQTQFCLQTSKHWNRQNNAFRYKNEISKKWLTSKKEICGWLEQKEKERLKGENIQRPNTKFVFEKKRRNVKIQAKMIIFVEQALHGRRWKLPDFITKKGLLSLDTYKTTTSVFSGVSLWTTEHISITTPRKRGSSWAMQQSLEKKKNDIRITTRFWKLVKPMLSHTGEKGQFRGEIKGAISIHFQSRPQSPLSFWSVPIARTRTRTSCFGSGQSPKGKRTLGTRLIHFALETLWAKPRHEKFAIVCNAAKGEKWKSLPAYSH